MKIADQIVLPLINGVISVHQVSDIDQSSRHILTQSNQIQYEWGAIAAECLRGNRNFRISSLYIEFENVASPGNAVTVPTFGREEGRSYYQDLQDSSVRDFLRVPLTLQPTISIQSGREDYFEEGVTGNVLTFTCQTQGTAGFHGKAFNNSVNSKVFGVALVATPVFSDPSQDLIMARSYFSSGNQTLKDASHSVGITWNIILG